MGAEYIILDKVDGVQLVKVWDEILPAQKGKVGHVIVKQQKAWTRMKFDSIGSLYRYVSGLSSPQRSELLYTDTVPGGAVRSDRFAIGPVTSRPWLDCGRAGIECHRGPWTSIHDYTQPMNEREMKAFQAVDRLPRPISMICGPGYFQPTRERKMRACNAAAAALRPPLPIAPWMPDYNIWDDDLHHENIFVDPADPTNVLGIIDWQSAAVLPFVEHTIVPVYLDYDGPALAGPTRPTEPEELDDAAWKLYEDQAVRYVYKHHLNSAVPSAFEASKDMESSESNLLTAAGRVLDILESACRYRVAEMPDSPVAFTEDERREIEGEVQATLASMHLMSVIERHPGDFFPEKGVVTHEQYDKTKAALLNAKLQSLDDFAETPEDRKAFEIAWPFDD